MLNKRTVYALHALIHLAKEGDGARLGASALAERVGCSHKFLERILTELRQAGTLNSTSGRSGGYSLHPNAAGISLAEIIRPLEGPVARQRDGRDAAPERVHHRAHACALWARPLTACVADAVAAPDGRR